MTNTIKKLIWLIDTIQSAGRISLKDINSKWRIASCNDEKTGEINRRTFLRYKEQISTMFGFEIVFNKADGNTYSMIDEASDWEKQTRKWILNSLSVQNLLQESQGVKDRILLEDIPSGAQYLIPILDAMKRSCTITIEYQKFGENTSTPRHLEPYSLKLDKQRWYLLAFDKQKKSLRIFSLDRIKDLTITDEQFTINADFDAAQYFKDVIGVFVPEEIKTQKVSIRVNEKIANYLRTLPLHSSQTEDSTRDGWTTFNYFVKPDVEFKNELRRHGAQIEILSPATLRNEFTEEARKMTELYAGS